MPTREQLNELGKRMLANLESGTTDMAADVYRIPLTRYTDQERWEAEVDRLFKKGPIVLGATAELRNPGEYKALEVVGIPLLLVRQKDGSVKGFLNTCRHRGAPLAEVGTGKTRRFTCPYHAWSFDTTGALVGIAQQDTFGDVDASCLSLKEIEVAERVGLIFGVIRPQEEKLDLDAWLGDFAEELAGFELDQRHVFSTRELPAANWKLIYDGYLEGYHFAALHTNTINTVNFSNLMGIDAYGPHQRVTFARRTLVELREMDEGDWRPEQHLGVVQALFPNVAISSMYGGQYAMLSILYPGTTIDTSITTQILLLLEPAETEEEIEGAQYMSDFYYRAVTEEDYWMNNFIQRGFESGANEELIFGRNEMALHHFHNWVDRLVEQ